MLFCNIVGTGDRRACREIFWCVAFESCGCVKSFSPEWTTWCDVMKYMPKMITSTLCWASVFCGA